MFGIPGESSRCFTEEVGDESTMSDGDSESEPEEEPTEEDRAFLDDCDIPTDPSMYRRMENEAHPFEPHAPHPSTSTLTPENSEDDRMRGYLYPIRIAPEIGPRHVNLLLTEHDNTGHYSAIKNLNGLLRAQYTKSGSHKHLPVSSRLSSEER